MERLLAPLFVVLIVMFFLWFACVRRLKRHLLERHPQTYDDLDMESIFDWENNSGAVMAMLRFLWHREYLDLQDEALERLGTFMRRLGITYAVLFALLFAGVVVHLTAEQRREAAEMAAADAGSARAPESAELRRAFDLHLQRKYAEAVDVYDDIERAGGTTAEMYYWRGVANWHLQRMDRALGDFRKVMREEPGNFQAHQFADRILGSQKRWDEVLQVWHGYLAAVPRDAEGYFERGGAYYRKGDLAYARADAARACELGKQEACAMVERLDRK